jgi:hypothetical protein
MALVRNNSQHPVTLTVGQLAAFEERNIDVSGANEVALIANGVLTVVDPAQNPPASPEPLATTPRRTFIASTQPQNLQIGDVWMQPTGTGTFNVWEMT